MSSISENLRFKGQRYGHNMTKYGQNLESKVKVIRWPNMGKNAVLEPSLYFKALGSNFCRLLGQCLAFLKIWGSKVKVTRWPNIGTNQLWSHIHLQRRFLKANLWPRHIESTCGRRHPIDVLASNSIWCIFRFMNAYATRLGRREKLKLKCFVFGCTKSLIFAHFFQ